MTLTPPIRLFDGERQVLESRPWKSTAQFAQEDFVLVAGPYQGQRFRHDKLPYARWIMDLWDRPALRVLFILAPSQTGKTTIAYACIGSEVSRDPCSFGIGMPDKDTRDRIFEEKLGPHFQKSPALREMLVDGREAVQRGKILTRFGACYGMYAGSDASASSVSLRVVGIDEEDAYLDKKAVSRMLERTLSYDEEAKAIRFSKVRGNEQQSTIWTDMKREAQVVYEIQARCPNCGTYQVMRQDRIKVPPKMRDPRKIRNQRAAWYECEGCAMRWNDHYRNIAVQRGRLYAEQKVENPMCVAVHVPSWCSPNVSLSTVMADWFTALDKGTPSAMEWFDNSHPCKPHKVVTVKTSEDQIREMVAHDRPPRIVPSEAVALTMGADSQKASFFYVVRAWAKSGESWLVDYGEVLTEEELHTLAFRNVYPVEGREDVVMPIYRAAIDFGGTRDESRSEGWSRSEEVKLMVKGWERDNFHLVKGASRKQDTVVRRSQTVIDRSVPREYQEEVAFFTLDTVDLKDLIFLTRLRPDSMQPMWLHAEVGEDYIRQLNSEERHEDSKGGAKWVAKGANHLLDCEVYAAACAHPEWSPAIQLLPEPAYRPAVIPESIETGSRSPLSGRVANPFYRR
ncbi:terminase gpA endonuclease subunit [Desulfovibrio oxyclinae]|uniref:terminase gpA endonuclease subunit n=1 Tax=Desulfovibrio oxyclinae TaxID=63560 RepID=UPI00037774AB|nr:terminase gpA endonuclease subunit [Desulfovibrio oxyclinae]